MLVIYRSLRRKKAVQQHNNDCAQNNEEQKQPIPSEIDSCENLVKTTFCNSYDLVYQVFETTCEKAMIVFIDGLVNKDLVDRDIIKPIKSDGFQGNLSYAIKSIFEETDDFNKVVSNVIGGHVALFYGKSSKAYLVELRLWEQRAVEESNAEAVIRGPKEGFTENIRTNTALVRRKIRNHKLVIENRTMGRQTSTPVELAYINGIVNMQVLAEVKNRLDRIDVDSIMESGYIEQYICQNAFSPISGIGLSQKPDVVAEKILEGRVAVFCDGTPHVLIIPELFIENLHTAEDYYSRTVITSIIRILRGIALFITVMVPGLAIAILTYHHEMVPSVFLTNTINASLKTPMPLWAEVFLLTLMFELLREAGTRMPKAVGSAITIVGSLIIGEAAVSAGIVSEPMVIVVAITAVTGFMLPNLQEFMIVYRTLFLLLALLMGLIGIGTGILIMMTQLISTHSFGIPILSSFSKEELKDSFIRFRLKSLKQRPQTIENNNRTRKA